MLSDEDYQEIENFLTSFSKLKELCENEPSILASIFTSDDSLIDVCVQCVSSYCYLNDTLRNSNETILLNFDQYFIENFRDFENRYIFVCLIYSSKKINPDASEHINKILKGLDKETCKFWSNLPNLRSSMKIEWEDHNEKAKEYIKYFSHAETFGNGLMIYLQNDNRLKNYLSNLEGDGIFDENSIEYADKGFELMSSIYSLDDLFNSEESEFYIHDENYYKIDLKGLFRRRELIPHVMVPQKLSSGETSDLKVSMYSLLREAHRAFLFGAYFAAISMLRSVMEVLLRDHYGLGGVNANGLPKSLYEMIEDAEGLLPERVWTFHLHRIRKKANQILHGYYRKDSRSKEESIADIEIEIVEYIHTLRHLIEGIPRS